MTMLGFGKLTKAVWDGGNGDELLEWSLLLAYDAYLGGSRLP